MPRRGERRLRPARSRRRGAMLLEVVIALALFVGAASFTISSMRTALAALDREARSALALDLARSKLAEIEAGSSDLADLRDGDGALDRVGSVEVDDPTSPSAWSARWTVDVASERSEFTGLVLVAITVAEIDDGDPATVEIAETVRALVPAGRDGEAEEFEEDEIMRGLPEGDAPGAGR